MQEFSSISVSSYEAGVLADRLTEQSREGWEVVAIVPTGSTVTAYLSRPAGSGGTAEPAEPVAAGAEVVPAEPEPEPEPEVEPEPAADTEADEQADKADDAEENAQADAETVIEEIRPEAAPDDTGWAALASEVADAAATEETMPTLPESAPADTAIEPEPASSEQTAAAPAAEATAEVAAAGGAAPAGWYADPSARFELRYWDGAQWTEHVSRAGQQYTDPPVA